MSGKRDWRKAHLASKRSLSTKDEDEYRGKDAAARWLAKRAPKSKPSRTTKDTPHSATVTS